MIQSSRPADNSTRDAEPRRLRLDAFCASHPGLARDHNEDAIRGTPLDYEPAKERGYLFIVADGMGGHNAGEIASNEAAQRVYQRYYAETDPDVHRCLETGIRSANAELYAQAQADPEQQGMGTTLTAAVIQGNHLYVAHVGDSRLYLIRNDVLEQVTVDHSWVEEQVRAGVLTRSQASNHPQRNVITRALATTPDVQVDHFDRDLMAGDVVVLCSDGLNTEVSEAQITFTIAQTTTARATAQALIKQALENGGRDNVSVATLRVTSGSVAGKTALGRGGRPWLLASIAAAALLVVLGGVVLFAPDILGRPTPAPPPAQLPSPSPAATQPVAPVTSVAGTVSVVVHPTATQTGAGAPTVTAAPTPKPATPTPTSPSATPSTHTPTAKPAGLAVPDLNKPEQNETKNGPVTFEWKGIDLPKGAKYEVVWWKQGENPEKAEGFADPTAQTRLDVDLRGIAGLPTDQVFYWTVLVVEPSPYKRLLQPAISVSRQLVFKRDDECREECKEPTFDGDGNRTGCARSEQVCN